MRSTPWVTLLLFHAGVRSSSSFVVHSAPRAFRDAVSINSAADNTEQDVITITNAADADEDVDRPPTAVRAPLKYVGPYPCLPLRFPNLATPSQRERNVTGIALDFVLDTAANTNTINAQVAKELGLEVVGQALPGVGAAGSISGGDTYMLGDCQIEGLSKEEAFTFMQGLTASALPVASPAAAGLLGLYFFLCFEGGIVFEWGSNGMNQLAEDGASTSTIPSVTFFSDEEKLKSALDGLKKAPIKPLPVSSLPSVDLMINGKKIPALLDTGSPITVINAEAARLSGVDTSTEDNESSAANSFNPFAKLSENFKSAQAAARGDILLIAGSDGQRVELIKSKTAVDIGLAGGNHDTNTDEPIALGNYNIYVGDLPGLAALGGLGGSGAPPAAVLGMDILRTRPRMAYRPNRDVYL